MTEQAPSRSPRSPLLAVLCLAAALALALPAASVEQGCGNSLGYDIRFSHDFGEIPSISSDR
ncbi:MAG TPA: hypothetical protein VLF66_10820, partial [Thermoanaerobaculia bacterium]|nr:hypothetical protein [Thermoanaerobaculia bacterium]